MKHDNDDMMTTERGRSRAYPRQYLGSTLHLVFPFTSRRLTLRIWIISRTSGIESNKSEALISLILR